MYYFRLNHFIALYLSIGQWSENFRFSSWKMSVESTNNDDDVADQRPPRCRMVISIVGRNAASIEPSAAVQDTVALVSAWAIR